MWIYRNVFRRFNEIKGLRDNFQFDEVNNERAMLHEQNIRVALLVLRKLKIQWNSMEKKTKIL